MKLLIDMNLSPEWVPQLRGRGVDAAHWSTIGDAKAPDHVILEHARRGGWIVFTHDLDFGAILAATGGRSPSVIQARTQDVTPARLMPLLLAVIDQCGEALAAGAIVVIDESDRRVRLLPIRPE